MKLTRGGFYGAFILLLALSPVIMGGCELINTSLTDYFLDNSEIVRATGFAVKTEHVLKDGAVLIPPGETTVIAIALANPRNLSVKQELAGAPEGKSITLRQSSPKELELTIAGATEGDDYDLTLALQSGDGLRDFPSYPLRTRCVSFETRLGNFLINDVTLPSFDPEQEAFGVNVPYSQSSAVFMGTTAHSGATIALYAGTDDTGEPLVTGTHWVEIERTLEVGDNDFYVKITAPSLTVQGYVVTAYRASASETGIGDFYFVINGKGYGYGPGAEPGSGSILDNAIRITVPYGTDPGALSATARYTGDAISPNPGTARSYANPVSYTVTSREGRPRTYTVTVTVAPDLGKAITAFSILTPANVAGTIDEGAKTITVTVPYGTAVTAMTATASHTGVSIDPDPATARSYASPVAYTVTAEDGASETYTVTVDVTPDTAKSITAFSITGPASATGTIDEEAKTITAILPYGTAVTAMTATASHSGVSISPNPATAKNYAAPVTYTVTATDGTAQTYTVTVILAKIESLTAVNGNFIAPNGVKQTEGFVNGSDIKDKITSVTGTDSLGTDITLRAADYSVEDLAGVATGTTATATLRVPGSKTSDGTDKTREFSVYIGKDTKEITAFSITEPLAATGTVNGTLKTIELIVPYGTAVTAMTASATHTGASISPDPTVARNYAGPVTYTVTAEDGTTTAYTVTAIRLPGITIGVTVKGLDALSFDGLPALPVAANTPITVAISGGVTVSSWYINVNRGDTATTFTTASFTAPPDAGFYNVNVIATVDGVDYSGSFGITVK